MSVSGKIMLRKRTLIKSVNDKLKNIDQIEHSRHRPFANFRTNAMRDIAVILHIPEETVYLFGICC